MVSSLTMPPQKLGFVYNHRKLKINRIIDAGVDIRYSFPNSAKENICEISWIFRITKHGNSVRIQRTSFDPWLNFMLVFLELRKNKPTFHSVRLDLQVLFMIFTLHIWLFLDMHQINFCNIEEKSSENKWNRRFSLTSRAGPRFFEIRASDGCLLKMN